MTINLFKGDLVMKVSSKMMYLTALLATLVANPVFAQEAQAAATGSIDLRKFGIALGLGIAALGGTLGQSRAASAALDGIARNPAASDKLTTPLIIALAFIESLVLFAFLLNFL
jgi:F-type H+-transporting ATPase subunit c